jgi:hypothetical protein
MGTTALTKQVGGYPSLSTITNLVRVFQNDWQRGATQTYGEGKITTDQGAPIPGGNPSPQTLPALSSAIREVYRELRNVGEPRLIRDNVQANLPANSVTGPTIQTYLAFDGYWDGGVLNPSPVLPSDMIRPLRLWEQQTGNQLPFIPMKQPQFGLTSRNQTFALGEWEWREDQLNFVGALCPITIRMRYEAALAQFFPPQIFITSYSVSGGTITFQAANTLSAGQSVYLSGFVSAGTALNGVTALVVGATSTQFQVDVPGLSGTDLGVAMPVLNYAFVFASTYIPIMDCEEAVAYKTAAKISKALSGVTPSTTDLDTKAAEAMFQLKNAVARRAQTVEYRREEYTGDHRGDERNLI